MLNEDPSKIFIGVRFLLYGFDLDKKQQIRSKLVEGGGVDVSVYRPDCTHLIVDHVIYDCPLCVSARQDGKIVVTSLWVDHSVDVGMPVDHHSIIYRPPKDLNGIKGAKSLVVCLTGYLRHDRDDIMTMVRLMGADFSKPLVANKVTHLICYKFEGEKYELAKKMQTIKLVNHRWLEDCLRSWEILPEADYEKSGYELEMMEAEAKDSEEEREDMATNRFGEKVAIEGPEDSKSPNQFLVKQEISTNISGSSTFRGLSGLGSTKELPLSSLKQSKSDQVPAFEESPKGEMLNTNFGRTYDELPSTMLQNGSDMVFVANSSKKSSHSCSSRETPRKFSFPMTADKGRSYAGCPSATETRTEFDCLNLSPESEQVKSEIGAKTPRNISCSQRSRLPEKHKMDISDNCFTSPRTSHNPEGIPDGFLTANHNEELVSTSKSHSLQEVCSLLSSGNGAPSFDKGLNSDAVQQCHSTISNSVTQSTRQRCDEEALQSGTCWTMGSNGFSPATAGVNGPLDEVHDIKNPSPVNERRDMLKSNVLAEFHKAGEDSMSGSKPLKKKSLSKKTLGPRQSLSKGNARNQKGSIFINKTVLMDDPAASTSGGGEGTGYQDIQSSTKAEVLPEDNADTCKEIERDKNLDSGIEAAKATESINDDTEAPEDQEDDELNVLREKPTESAPQHSGFRSMEKNPKVNQLVNENDVGKRHDTEAPEDQENDNLDVLRDKPTESEAEHSGLRSSVKKSKVNKLVNENDVAKRHCTEDNKSVAPKTFSGKKTNLCESTSVGKHPEEKVSKGPNYLTKKSKKKNLAPKRAASSTEGAEMKRCKTDGKKAGAQKGKGSPSGTGKSAVLATEDQLENSMDVDKENIPFIGCQNTSHNKNGGEKTSPCDKKPCSLRVTKVGSEPRWFILSGHRLQRKEFQQVIKRLKGKVCRDSHQWSYQATHFILPAPVRRTEKFFAAASSGRWILKTDYLTACNEAGKFLDEEPYEWQKKGLTEDLAINLEAPRKWRHLRERTGHGALYGMKIIIYGDCIVPPLDTLKRAIKAGDGTILATSPPYGRFLESGVDFAIVSEVMPCCDKWVQEFLRHEIPCVLPDYLVTYVCKPGFTLSNYVQYNTHAWAERSLKTHANRLEEVVEEMVPLDDNRNDLACQVCGLPDREEVMLICGDESGSLGCGNGMHVDCCDPPLECVPEEDWFCPECSKNRSNTGIQRKSRKGTSTSKRKKK